MLEGRDPISVIEKLLDELESYAEKSPWYLPNKIAIPDEEFFRITQMIREKLPAELAEARSTLERRDLILKNAQDEHRRIMDTAERRLEDMTSEEKVVALAKQEARKIIERAALEADEIRREALSYTADLLGDMENKFAQSLDTVRNSRAFLTEAMDGPVAEEQEEAPVPGGEED